MCLRALLNGNLADASIKSDITAKAMVRVAITNFGILYMGGGGTQENPELSSGGQK